jgi:hypothetical protein
MSGSGVVQLNDGYSIDLAWDVDIDAVRTDILNAKPGRAELVPWLDATLAITNTTEGRNMQIVADDDDEQFSVGLEVYWPLDVLDTETQATCVASDSDLIRAGGQEHCRLLTLAFGYPGQPGNIPFGPGETVEFPLISTYLDGIHRIVDVSEDNAPMMADVLATVSPSVILLTDESTYWNADACTREWGPDVIVAAAGQEVFGPALDDGVAPVPSCDERLQ